MSYSSTINITFLPSVTMTENKHLILKRWIENPEDNDNTKTCATISESLEIIDDKILARCLQANDTIPNGSTVINIPKKFLLNYITVLKFISFWNEEVNAFLTKNISNYSNKLFKTSEDSVSEIQAKLPFEKLMDLTSHQLITLFLCLEKTRAKESWWYRFIDCLPQLHEYDNIPMTWNLKNSITTEKSLFNLLPKSTITHAEKQIKQFDLDLKCVDSLLSPLGVELKEEDYLWAWMAVNTRCLYFKLPSYLPITKSKNPEASNITLVPFIDYINHHFEDNNSEAKATKSGYEVKTVKDIETNDHLWFSYGPHNDEFLQCEYGFSLSTIERILPTEPEVNEKTTEFEFKCSSLNTYNTIDITEIMIKLLKNPKKKNVLEWLKQSGYYDDYTVGFEKIEESEDGEWKIKTIPSHRTRIAIAAMIENEDGFKFNEEQHSFMCPLKLEKFYQGYTEGEYYLKTESVLLKKIVGKLKLELTIKFNQLNRLETSSKVEVVKNLLASELFMIQNL